MDLGVFILLEMMVFAPLVFARRFKNYMAAMFIVLGIMTSASMMNFAWEDFSGVYVQVIENNIEVDVTNENFSSYLLRQSVYPIVDFDQKSIPLIKTGTMELDGELTHDQYYFVDESINEYDYSWVQSLFFVFHLFIFLIYMVLMWDALWEMKKGRSVFSE